MNNRRLQASRTWVPRGLGVAAFVLYVLVLPAAESGLSADLAGPLYRFLVRASALLPVGGLAFRVAVLCAAGAAVCVWASARLALDLAGDDAAAVGGATVTGATAMFVMAVFASVMQPAVWAILAAVVAISLVLIIRVARGGGAGAGLGLALCLGLGAGVHPVFVVLWPVSGVLLFVRVRRGAKWPLCAPAMTVFATGLAYAAVPITGASDWTAMRASVVKPDFGTALSVAERALADLGFIAVALAAGGALLLAVKERRWVLAALGSLGVGQLVAAAVLAPSISSHPGSGVGLVLVGCVAAGVGAARLVRALGRGAAFAAIPLALMTAALPALTSLGRLADGGWRGGRQIDPRDVRQVEVVDGEVGDDGRADVAEGLERQPEDRAEQKR